MGRVGIDDLEALQGLTLAKHEQAELLAAQTECTFVFANGDGWPSGVVMSYVEVEGVFWLTAVEGRAHTRALASDPRVTLVVSNAGTALPGRRMLAVRGVATVHRDAATKEWFFDRFTEKHQPDNRDSFTRLLNSLNRVVFKVQPVAVAVSHDSRKLTGNGRGAPDDDTARSTSIR
jgi:general stress protein 26